MLSLCWQDVDWAAGRIVVQSPNTEHHLGEETGTIPLFGDLRPWLEQAFELAPERAVYVVDERFHKAALVASGRRNFNLRTTFLKIIKRAGLKASARTFAFRLRTLFELAAVATDTCGFHQRRHSC